MYIILCFVYYTFQPCWLLLSTIVKCVLQLVIFKQYECNLSPGKCTRILSLLVPYRQPVTVCDVWKNACTIHCVCIDENFNHKLRIFGSYKPLKGNFLC